MATKLPWYIIPIYPGLSLLIGASLALAWQAKTYPLTWKIALAFLAIICAIASGYLGLSGQVELDLALIVGLLVFSFTVAAILIFSSSRNFITVIIGGFYLTLLLLFNSSYWLWELNEAFPVKPLATQIQQYTPPQQKIYTAYPNLRPSLEFYSDRVIIPATDPQLKQLWQQNQPAYLLLNSEAIERLNLQKYVTLGKKLDYIDWQIISNL